MRDQSTTRGNTEPSPNSAIGSTSDKTRTQRVANRIARIQARTRNSGDTQNAIHNSPEALAKHDELKIIIQSSMESRIQDLGIFERTPLFDPSEPQPTRDAERVMTRSNLSPLGPILPAGLKNGETYAFVEYFTIGIPDHRRIKAPNPFPKSKRWPLKTPLSTVGAPSQRAQEGTVDTIGVRVLAGTRTSSDRADMIEMGRYTHVSRQEQAGNEATSLGDTVVEADLVILHRIQEIMELNDFAIGSGALAPTPNYQSKQSIFGSQTRTSVTRHLQ